MQQEGKFTSLAEEAEQKTKKLKKLWKKFQEVRLAQCDQRRTKPCPPAPHTPRRLTLGVRHIWNAGQRRGGGHVQGVPAREGGLAREHPHAPGPDAAQGHGHRGLHPARGGAKGHAARALGRGARGEEGAREHTFLPQPERAHARPRAWQPRITRRGTQRVANCCAVVPCTVAAKAGVGAGASGGRGQARRRHAQAARERRRAQEAHVRLCQARLGHGRHEPQVRCTARWRRAGWGQGQGWSRARAWNRVAWPCPTLSLRAGSRARTSSTWSWTCPSAPRTTTRGRASTRACR